MIKELNGARVFIIGWDRGSIISLGLLMTPIFCAVYRRAENISTGVEWLNYRHVYIFGIRIIRYQIQ